MRSSQRGASKIGMIVTWIIIVCAGWYFVANRPKSETQQIQESNLASPGDAVKFYASNAWDFTHGSELIYNKIQACVTKDDWDWFQANYQRIFDERDPVNVAGAIAADQTVLLSRLVIMKDLLSSGPSRQDCEVVEESIEGDSAHVVVKQIGEQGIFYEFPVELSKEDGAWKVKGFAGGRDRLSGVWTSMPPEEAIPSFDETVPPQGEMSMPQETVTPSPQGAMPPQGM